MHTVDLAVAEKLPGKHTLHCAEPAAARSEQADDAGHKHTASKYVSSQAFSGGMPHCQVKWSNLYAAAGPSNQNQTTTPTFAG